MTDPDDKAPAKKSLDDTFFEREKLSLEREKVSLERKKVELEEIKTRWIAISVSIPLLAAILTVAFGFWSNNEQAKHQFELKAAEIVMQSGTPYEALARARAFVALFPQHFSSNFAQAFEPGKYADRHEEARLDLLQLMGDKLTKEEIIKVWRKLFPTDEWAKNLPFEAVPQAPKKTGSDQRRAK